MPGAGWDWLVDSRVHCNLSRWIGEDQLLGW